ncbi:MAG: hypothetical protein ACRBBN_12670 [Methyloligellaceae bacterium]
MSRKQGQKSKSKSSNTKTNTASGNSDQQAQKNTPKQSATEKVGQKKSKPLTLGQTEKITKKHGLELETDEKGKRVYRKKKEELFDPTKDPTSEANRLKVRLSTRVSREHAALFKKVAEGEYATQQEALEFAIELLAQHHDYDIK